MLLPFGFSIQFFFIFSCPCQKPAFLCQFQNNPLEKRNFLANLHTFGEYEFFPPIPNSNKNKEMKSSNPTLRKKMVLLPSKTVLFLSGAVGKYCLLYLEYYDVANGKE
jgi:hypothetical protein